MLILQRLDTQSLSSHYFKQCSERSTRNICILYIAYIGVELFLKFKFSSPLGFTYFLKNNSQKKKKQFHEITTDKNPNVTLDKTLLQCVCDFIWATSSFYLCTSTSYSLYVQERRFALFIAHFSNIYSCTTH